MEFLELTTLGWAAILLSALLVGLTKAGFGSGAGILAVPLMTLGLGHASDMLAVMLPVLICGDIFSLIHYPKQKDWKNLAMLIPASAAGIAIGWGVLWIFGELSGTGELLLRKLVGGVCVFFVGVQVWRYFREQRLTERPEPYKPKIWHGAGLGTTAGLTSTLAHAAGPLIALFLLPQKLDKKVFVGTSVTYFFFGNLFKVIPYGAQGMFPTPRLYTSLTLMPAVIAGTLIGVYLNRKISLRAFVLVIYTAAFLMGLKLVLS